MLDLVFGIIGTILYPLFSIIFFLLDGVQNIFYSFAGIGSSYYGSGGNVIGGTMIGAGNSGTENDTGLLYFLLNHSLVKNMVMSIMLLAFFLIIIFTVFAFVKNIYIAKPKTWKEIVFNAIKGIGNFVMLPVLMLLGVWIGNIILVAINGATSHGSAVKMSRKLFSASAYNANIYRNSNGGIFNDPYEKVSALVSGSGLEITVEKNQSDEYYAGIVDQVYAESNISIYDWISVRNFYNLYQINYLILVVGGIFMLYLLGQLTAGMVKRLFNLILYFIVSPVTCAMYPIDEGGATKTWVGQVKKDYLSVFGAVAGMNIFYSILPLIENITIGSSIAAAAANSTLMNDIAQLFIMTIGLDMVKGFVSFVNSLIGGGDPWGSLKDPYNKIKKYGKKAIKAGSMVTRYSQGAFQTMGNIGGAAASTVSSWFKGAGAVASNAAGKVSDSLEQAKLHRYARKHGFGEGRGKNFEYYDFGDDTNMNDDYIRGEIAANKSARRERFMNKVDSVKHGVKDGLNKAKSGIEGGLNKAKSAVGGLADKVKSGVEERKDLSERRRFARESGLLDDGDHFENEYNAYKKQKAAEKQAKADRRKQLVDDAKSWVGDKARWVGDKASDLGDAVGSVGAWVGDKAASAGRAVSGFAKSQVKAAKESKLAETLSDEKTKFVNGAKSVGRTIYAETGLDKEIGEYTNEWSDARKRIESRDKDAKKGKYGINEAVEKAKKYSSGAHIDSMASHLLDDMGEKIGNGLFKAFMQSEASSAFREQMGLNEKSTASDMAYLDSVLQKLEHFKNRINDEDAPLAQTEAWMEAAKKFAMETDSKGNAQLQKALNEAFKQFSNRDLCIKGQVEFDKNAFVGAMIDASKKSNKDLAKYLEEFAKDIVKQIQKDEKK